MNVTCCSLFLALLCCSFLVSCTETFDLESTFHSIFAGSASEPSARTFIAEPGAAVEESDSSSSAGETEALIEVDNARSSEASTQVPPYHPPNFEAFPRISRAEQLMLGNFRVVEEVLDYPVDVEAPFHAPTLQADNPMSEADQIVFQAHSERILLRSLFVDKMIKVQFFCAFIVFITVMSLGPEYTDDLLKLYLGVAIGLYVSGLIGYVILT